MNYFLKEDIDHILDTCWNSILKLSGKTIIVTGAAGFIGKYFVEVLRVFNDRVDLPVKVIAIDNHVSSSYTAENDKNIKWIYDDISNTNLPDEFDYIIHAAGIASPEHYLANPIETIDVAVNSTLKILEKAKTANAKVLFFSSSEVYGNPLEGHIPTKESYPGNVSTLGPRACYDESKRLGETLCWIYQTKYNVDINIVRPFNIYGPGMMADDYRVMPNFANCVVYNKMINIYGDGSHTRTFCYITDAMNYLFKILCDIDKPDVFNIGNTSPEISMHDLAMFIKNTYGIDFNLIAYPEQYPKDQILRRCPDVSKVIKATGYIPIVDLYSGVNRFISWAKENY